MGTSTVQGSCWYDREQRLALKKMTNVMKAAVAVLLVSLTLSRGEGKKVYTEEDCKLVQRQMSKKGCKAVDNGPQDIPICQKKHYRFCKKGCLNGTAPKDGPCLAA